MGNSLGRAMAGGLAGTVAMTMTMYGAGPMMGLHMDIAAMLGSMMGGVWILGLLAHLMLGVAVFPMIFARGVLGRLPGPAILQGVIFGVGLWLMQQAIVMPMMGFGIFSANAGGMLAAVGALMAHLIYGALLGAIAAPALTRALRA